MPDAQSMIERLSDAAWTHLETIYDAGKGGNDPVYVAREIDVIDGVVDMQALVRAVITAMREPTEAAIDIGIFKMRSGGPMSPDERVTAIWSSMIDAAMEDGR